MFALDTVELEDCILGIGLETIGRLYPTELAVAHPSYRNTPIRSSEEGNVFGRGAQTCAARTDRKHNIGFRIDPPRLRFPFRLTGTPLIVTLEAVDARLRSDRRDI